MRQWKHYSRTKHFVSSATLSQLSQRLLVSFFRLSLESCTYMVSLANKNHIISMFVSVCVCVCVLRKVTGSDSTSSQMLLLSLGDGDCRPKRGCEVQVPLLFSLLKLWSGTSNNLPCSRYTNEMHAHARSGQASEPHSL